jgi:hypothetical protein
LASLASISRRISGIGLPAALMSPANGKVNIPLAVTVCDGSVTKLPDRIPAATVSNIETCITSPTPTQISGVACISSITWPTLAAALSEPIHMANRPDEADVEHETGPAHTAAYEVGIIRFILLRQFSERVTLPRTSSRKALLHGFIAPAQPFGCAAP